MANSEASTPNHKFDARTIQLLVIITIVSIIIVAVFAFLTWSPRIGTAHILAVTISPNTPSPGETITITAEVESEPTNWQPDVLLEYYAYFASHGKDGGLMHHSGGNFYTRNIGPFLNGTEIWLVVIASLYSKHPDLNADHIIQIGTVLRGGPSGLLIENLNHTPQQPRRGDTVRITADVTSNATLDEVTLIFSHISSTDFGIANRTMTAQPSGTFAITIENPFLFGYIYEPGTLIFYRVVTRDATGNTALTLIHSYTIV